MIVEQFRVYILNLTLLYVYYLFFIFLQYSIIKNSNAQYR